MSTDTRKPRISVNKLAEYMEANPIRRRQIVRDAQNPEPFIVTRYSDARTAVRDYFASRYDGAGLNAAMDGIRGKVASTDFQKDDQRNSISCLEILLDIDLPDLSDYIITHNDVASAMIDMAGVDVSVLPDLLLKHKETGRVGCIKVSITKTTPLSNDALKNVAVVLQRFLTERGGSVVDGSACFSVDVFGGRYEACPQSYKLLTARLEAACEEIRLRWVSA